MSLFDSITPKDLSVLANLVALTLTDGKSASDNNVLGNFLAAISANILNIASQQENLKSLEEKQNQIKDLQKQIKQLKK
ncbi:hypothetical protein AB8U03_12715 [Clostridium sp. Mt-5]|uniref:Uncharacterized protein n=1 Tax=Clostridium moutaii TaxID=3240932 RepID=A0ABV4BQI3_9CLOT